MDMLAVMLAYVAGIGALFAALAVSFIVFFATPHQPLQTEPQPQNARAMLVQPSTLNKPALEARAKQNATQSASLLKKLPKNIRQRLGSLYSRMHPEIPAAKARHPRRRRGGSSRRNTPAAGPTSRTQAKTQGKTQDKIQALRAGFSVTPIEFGRNVQA